MRAALARSGPPCPPSWLADAHMQLRPGAGAVAAASASGAAAAAAADANCKHPQHHRPQVRHLLHPRLLSAARSGQASTLRAVDVLETLIGRPEEDEEEDCSQPPPLALLCALRVGLAEGAGRGAPNPDFEAALAVLPLHLRRVAVLVAAAACPALHARPDILSALRQLPLPRLDLSGSSVTNRSVAAVLAPWRLQRHCHQPAARSLPLAPSTSSSAATGTKLGVPPPTTPDAPPDSNSPPADPADSLEQVADDWEELLGDGEGRDDETALMAAAAAPALLPLHLVALDLSFCPGLAGGLDLVEILASTLPKLRQLRLAGNFSPRTGLQTWAAILEGLPQLTLLDLSHSTYLDEAALNRLRHPSVMPVLRTLLIVGCPLVCLLPIAARHSIQYSPRLHPSP